MLAALSTKGKLRDDRAAFRDALEKILK